MTVVSSGLACAFAALIVAVAATNIDDTYPRRRKLLMLSLALSAMAVTLSVTAVIASAGTGWHRALASWYGPGLYGGPLACGGTLHENTLGVAHKSLPCGTRLQIRYHGRTRTARVIDRGPYVGPREFDLAAGTRAQLRFDGVDTIRWRKVRAVSRARIEPAPLRLDATGGLLAPRADQ